MLDGHIVRRLRSRRRVGARETHGLDRGHDGLVGCHAWVCRPGLRRRHRRRGVRHLHRERHPWSDAWWDRDVDREAVNLRLDRGSGAGARWALDLDHLSRCRLRRWHRGAATARAALVLHRHRQRDSHLIIRRGVVLRRATGCGVPRVMLATTRIAAAAVRRHGGANRRLQRRVILLPQRGAGFLPRGWAEGAVLRVAVHGPPHARKPLVQLRVVCRVSDDLLLHTFLIPPDQLQQSTAIGARARRVDAHARLVPGEHERLQHA